MTDSKTPNTDALIKTLTIEHAREYSKQTDKLIWIETNLLDQRGIPRKMATRVEDALIAFLDKQQLASAAQE